MRVKTKWRKNHWRSQRGTRTNGGKTGRRVDNRAQRREQRRRGVR